MTSGTNSTDSTAVVLYNPSLPHNLAKSNLEARTQAAYQRSFEIAKTGRHPVSLSNTHLIPPQNLQTDPRIDIEIFAAPAGEHKPPILIFSHGMGTPPVRYRPLLVELASHGFTVLSLNHASSLQALPELSPEEENATAEKLAHIMANNIQYVLSEVRSGKLKGIGDTNKIVLGGHSLGGAASIMVSRNDTQVAGCVNLDGFLHGKMKTEGLKQPLLMVIGDYQNLIRMLEQDPQKEARDYAKHMSQSLVEYSMLNRNSRDSEKLMIENAVHMDFTDQPFFDYLAGKKSGADAMRVHTIVSQQMLKFMNDLNSPNYVSLSERSWYFNRTCAE